MTRARGRARPQRRYARLTVRVDVLLESVAECRRAVATTLGAGGLFVATAAPWPKGTALVVRLRLPDGEDGEAWLAVAARVAWIHPPEAIVPAPGHTPGMGLEFVDRGARAVLAARLERWAAAREAAALSDAEGL